jgi:NmrA-like family
MAQEDTLVVAVSAVTGALGAALVAQIAKLNKQRSPSQPLLYARGLTRDSTSPQAQELLQQYSKILTLVEVDYDSPKSIRRALKGCQAFFLKCPIPLTQTKVYYERMIDCAIQVKIPHIVYASHVACEKEHTIPHWTRARHTEGYLAIRQDETHPAFTYQVLRFAHLNEYLLMPPQAPDNGWIAYPWQPSIRIHTASAKDGARVACKLILNPTSLKSGAILNLVTDYKNPHEMAQFITLATGIPVQAYKGPASVVTMGQLMGYHNRTIAAMGEYIEAEWTPEIVKPTRTNLQEFLNDELKEEPLETLEAFVNRAFAKPEEKEAQPNQDI